MRVVVTGALMIFFNNPIETLLVRRVDQATPPSFPPALLVGPARLPVKQMVCHGGVAGVKWTSAGVPKVRPQDARHTAATLMLGQGVHPKLISEMLGHKSIAITLDLYSHATQPMHREAANTLDALLRKSSG